MTVNELTMRTWYLQNIIIKKDDNECTWLFEGGNDALRSDLYKELLSQEVRSIGATNDTLIITVNK